MVKSYVKGVIPLLIWVVFVSFPVRHGNFQLTFTWWAVYAVGSYAFCFPRAYRWLKRRMRVDKTQQIQRPRSNATQEALRTGSKVADTGKMGVVRIGDADNGYESWIIRWGTDFVARLFLIWAAPVIVGWQLWREKRKGV